MGPADDVAASAAASPPAGKYGTRIDSQSARELLAARLEASASDKPPVVKEEHRSAAKATKSGADELGDFLGSRQGKAIQREVIRGVFGMLRKRI
jgi:hypothetical protein